MGWCGNQVNLRMNLLQFFFQNYHGKHAGACGYVSGTDLYAVGGSHAGTSVALRRTHRNASLQIAAYIKQFCSLCS